MEKDIELAKKRLKQKYNVEFPVLTYEGEGGWADPQKKEIYIGINNPLNAIEALVIHEALHLVLKIHQKESLKERERGNPLPYFKEEMLIWNKIVEDFPELSFVVGMCIKAQKRALKINKL